MQMWNRNAMNIKIALFAMQMETSAVIEWHKMILADEIHRVDTS